MPTQNWIILSLVLIFSNSYAQNLKKQTLSSHGSSHFVYANNKSYFIQEVTGQASVIKTYSTDSYQLRQGFLQPISASLISDASNTDLDGTIFPNPFYTHITVRFNEPVIDVLKVKLIDALGRIVVREEYDPIDNLVLNFNNLSSGNYILRIDMRSKVLLAKLIKR